MKSLILALMLAAPLGMAVSPISAEAKPKVNLDIYLGDYDYFRDRPGDGYLFRRGYGWYMPYDRYDRYDRRYRGNARYTCAQARRVVRDHGYSILSTRDCQGTQYSFRVKRGGRVFILNFNARSGALWRA
jgi:hypothetical protein